MAAAAKRAAAYHGFPEFIPPTLPTLGRLDGPLLPVIQLADVLRRRRGYSRVHQVGSHIILETSEPGHQRIAVPAHNPLRLGTLASLLRVVADHQNVSRYAIIETLRQTDRMLCTA
jgi:predicted RNA binding protein YcfA (HicA-like mRNA interferase family)